MARIYLASSWRNTFHQETLEALEDAGHQIYNFKQHGIANGLNTMGRDFNPKQNTPLGTAFSWVKIDPNWESWSPKEYLNKVFTHPIAAQGFVTDFSGMAWADTCVLLMPSGNSAHIEAGYMKGQNKRLIIYWPTNTPSTFSPDLMYMIADNIVIGTKDLLKVV